jgi:hypothetical protein
VQQAPRVLRAYKAKSVQPEPQALRVLKAFKVKSVQPEPQALRVLKAQQAPQVLRAYKVKSVQPVLRERLLRRLRLRMRRVPMILLKNLTPCLQICVQPGFLQPDLARRRIMCIATVLRRRFLHF